MLFELLVAPDLVKPATRSHIVKLIIKQYPVHKSMRFGLGDCYSRISQELIDIVTERRRIGLQHRCRWVTATRQPAYPADQRSQQVRQWTDRRSRCRAVQLVPAA